MHIVLIVLQEPDCGAHHSPVQGVHARTAKEEVGRLHLEVETGLRTQFLEHLESFIVHHMPSCRLDGTLVFTRHHMSWDPVSKIQNWAREWQAMPRVV